MIRNTLRDVLKYTCRYTTKYSKKYTEIHRIEPKYSKKCPEKDRNVC